MPTVYTADFQTRPEIARYMASLVPAGARSVLEPTPGIGNVVRALEAAGFDVTAAEDFFQIPKTARFDCIVMNPPFSAKYAFGVPDHLLGKGGMRLGYQILLECMRMSDNVIALMPWFTISDSDIRLRMIKKYGLKSLTALPRSTFEYARIQTCVFELQKGYKGETAFKVYDLLNHIEQPQIFSS